MSTPLLMIEDDTRLAQMVGAYLGQSGFVVEHKATATEGLARLQQPGGLPELVILDLMLPDMDGLEVCRRIRAAQGEMARVPVLMLTAKGDPLDRIIGLELGADDYVTKPFSPRELLARIRAVLRRYHVQTELAGRDDKRRAYRFAGWEFNLRTRKLGHADGRRLDLSNNEFSLLAAFCSAPQRVLSRDQLLQLSRLHNAEVYDRTVDVQVLRLRRKIEADPFTPQLILTERGAGYLFNANVETLY